MNHFSSLESTSPERDTDREERKRPRRAATVEEMHKLLTVSEDRVVVYLALYSTGLRRSELDAVKWGDLQLDIPEPLLLVRASTEKHPKGSTIPLHPDLAKMLVEHRPCDFEIQDHPLRVPRMDQVRKDPEAAGVPYRDDQGRYLDVHALRMTFSTMLTANGATPRETVELMRHGDPKLTLKTYTDSEKLRLRDAIKKLPSIVGDTRNRTHDSGSKGPDASATVSTSQSKSAAQTIDDESNSPFPSHTVRKRVWLLR